MKNISLGLNAILIVAVAILYYLHFSNTQPTKETTLKKEIVEVNEEGPITDNIITSKIAYLNTDTLRAQYKLYDQLINKLKRREKKYENELSAKSSAFEKEVMAFQKNAPTMTQFEGQMKQKELGKKEKELYELQEKFTNKFQNEQAKLDDEFQSKVNGFIKNFNKEASFNLIMGGYKGGSVVLDYNDGIDITREIVNGLNEQYDIENAPKEEKK